MSPAEIERLAALHAYGILDTAPEAPFDRITQLAAQLFGAPIALVSLVDAERQWFKSRVGLEATETPREYAFCDYTIRSDAVMVVADATTDERFRDNPLVTSEPEIRFYAGAPLTLPSGHRVGSLCVIDRRARPMLSAEDQQRLSVLAGVVVNEMELRLANQQLELARRAADAASEARAEFLANMSHELRTPLASVIGFAGLLAASENLPPKERRLADRIGVASNALLAVVNDVLDLAKLESDPDPEPTEPVDAAEVAREAFDIVTEQARQKGLAFEMRAEDDLPRVDVAAPRLRQVLINLLGNAVKFTAEGSVTLAINRAADRVRIQIADTGVGIAPERVDQIFERFVQADASVTRRYGGTGLGLAISRRLVERMGGEITVESIPGAGSTFTVSLPCAGSV